MCLFYLKLAITQQPGYVVGGGLNTSCLPEIFTPVNIIEGRTHHPTTGRGMNKLVIRIINANMQTIYDADNQFIHASTRRGVMRSSLDNVYWRKKFWQARRI